MGVGSSTSQQPPPFPRLPQSLDEVVDVKYRNETKQQFKQWLEFKNRNMKERMKVRLGQRNEESLWQYPKKCKKSARRVYTRGRLARDVRLITDEWREKLQPLKNHPFESLFAFGFGSSAGIIGFGAGRLLSAFALQSMRLSSSNMIGSHIGGACGMILCATLASQSTLTVSTLTAEYLHIPSWPLRPISPMEDDTFIPFTLFVTIGSWIQFRLLGGRLRRFAPSDVMRPGSFAHKSIPAISNAYADQRTKRLLHIAGGKYGCHSCGRSHSWWGLGPRLNFIGDHLPPNKYAKLADLASGAVVTPGMPRGVWSRLWPFKPKKTSQIFLPQCERCSLIQSQAVRFDRRRLIFPRSWRWYDIWLPIPLVMGLIILPCIQAFIRILDEEEQATESAIDLHPWRPTKRIRS